MIVILIMACATVGTIALLFLAGSARWSLIYLIRYRLLKKEVNDPHYELSKKKDISAAFIAIATICVTTILVVYGIPYVVEHISELPFHSNS